MTAILYYSLLQMLVVFVASIGVVFSPMMTDHAINAHAGQAVTAATMVETIKNNLNGDGSQCQPLIIGLCTRHAGQYSPHAKVICGFPGQDKAGGLVIGLKNKQPVVVTGYCARRSYWIKSFATDMCVPLDVSILEMYFRVMFPGLLQ